MITDWKNLATKTGSLLEDGSERGSDECAEKALDYILGDEWIENTVDYIISFKPGMSLATSCIRYFHSTKATEYAYKIYKSSDGDKANRAVLLIKDLANPISFDWIEEFLNDANVIASGLGVLDQLLWTEKIQYNDKVESLLKLADSNSNGQLKPHIEFITNYIKERNRSK